MRALIVGAGHERGSLTAVRSLARSGWTVGTATPGERGLFARSRYVARRHDVPSPEPGRDDFVHGVRDAIDAGGYDIVFCSGDADLFTLSARRAELGTRFPYPPHEIVERALDKSALYRVAADAGMAIPLTLPAGDGSPHELGFPLVVKSRSHRARAGTTERWEAEIVHDDAAASRSAARMAQAGLTPLFQERVDGDLMAYCCVVGPAGETLGAVQQVAQAVWPHPAGVSVRARTVAVDTELASTVEEFLRSLGWVGGAELQFIVPRDGKPRFIDLNGRFYGSMALAVRAGVDIPVLWAESTGKRNAPFVAGRTGIRYQWLEGDVIRTWRTNRHRLRGMSRAFAFAFGATHSILDAKDPMPGLVTALRMLHRGARSSWT